MKVKGAYADPVAGNITALALRDAKAVSGLRVKTAYMNTGIRNKPCDSAMLLLLW
jgi:hypothetical protein